MYQAPVEGGQKALIYKGLAAPKLRRKVVAFALSLGFLCAAYSGGAVGAVISPVGFGNKSRAADRTPFPAPPIQEGCCQFPLKGQNSYTEPAAHEGKGNALDAHARLPVV